MIKLLLVDNNKESCQILEQGLKEQGYDVITAQQEEQGLKLANTESPNLIFLNMTQEVPRVNSWRMVNVLKRSQKGQSIPVVAIVDHNLNGQLLEKAGFNTYVRMPVSFRHLLLRINVLLNRMLIAQPS
ncbi:MAG: response regulator [Leptolyngbyaceae cyanobacterium MAG.088]|nr:response regulator [Leptolyngbyaceae cyanobacterium MAG.088]